MKSWNLSVSELPTATQVFAFAVFFVPGYLSLNIASFLVEGKTLSMRWDEKIIVSYVWSLLIFLVSFSSLKIALTPESVTSSLTTAPLIVLLGATIGFGIIAALVYYIGRVMLHKGPAFGRAVSYRLGLRRMVDWLSEFQTGSTTEFFLNLIWQNRTKDSLIVETNSGRFFKGNLGSLSVEPTLDILLVRPSDMRALQELVKGEWTDLEEWSVLIPQGNIRTIEAIPSEEDDSEQAETGNSNKD